MLIKDDSSEMHEILPLADPKCCLGKGQLNLVQFIYQVESNIFQWRMPDSHDQNVYISQK